MNKLRMALGRMTKIQRRRVKMRFWENLTYQQIAKKEGISRQAAWKSVKIGLIKPIMRVDKYLQK